MVRRFRVEGIVLAALLGAGCVDVPAKSRSEVDASAATVTLASAPPVATSATVAQAGAGMIEVRDLEDDPPRAAGQMTEEAAQAKRLFDNERWQESSLVLKRVVDGETGDDDANRQLAQYRMAIALFKLEYFQSSYAIFAEVAHRTEHVKHGQTLPWLARLATLLPEPAEVVERIGKYDAAQLARFDNPQQRELFAQLSTLLGRYKVRNRDYEGALALLSKVDAKSRHFVTAQLAVGAAELGLHKPERAAAAFERIETAIGTGAVAAEDVRLRNLAQLLRGSALSASAFELDIKGAVKVDAKLLSAAVKSWQRVEPASEYWLDAALETASAYALAGDHASALRTLGWLQAAGVSAAVESEVDTLSAAVAFKLCRYTEADAAVAQMSQKLDPTVKELTALLARPAFQGDDAERAFLVFARQARAGNATLAASIKPLVEAAVANRSLSAQLEYLRVLGEEEARFKKAAASFRESPLGADVSDSVALAQELALRSAGQLGLGRLQRINDQLNASISPVLKTITSAGKSSAQKQAAQGELTTQLWQRRAGYAAATPELTGKGKQPPAPKTEPAPPVTTSKCTP